MELSNTRLFPSHRSPKEISTPLSILDATVARFSPTGAIWLFDNAPAGVNSLDFAERLRSSFVDTLNDFPHWAGQLRWGPVRQGGLHYERFNRPITLYGADGDPGVEWRVVRYPSTSPESLAPTPLERASESGIWMGDEFPQQLFLSDTPLPLHDLREFDGLPAMQVQISMFSDGGYGIGIKMAHCLADAQSLMVFVHQWAAISRGLFGADRPSMTGAPVFNPAQLDQSAAGDIDAVTADPTLVAEARQLPLHRFDWWRIHEPGYPDFLIPTTENSKPPLQDLVDVELSPSTPAPWKTWDFTRSVSYSQLHYTAEELDRLKRQARQNGHADISRLDALLGHIWAVINRARGHSEFPADVFLNFTLGARTRVSPPLPESFIGSPLFLTHIRMSGAEACTSSVGQTASQIRQTMHLFTCDKIGAKLHDAAYEVSPQRLWQAFLGIRHTLVTSWLRLNVYQVDFVGLRQRPRYVHAVIPKMDGCLQVMDPGLDDGGIDIALYLDAEAMQRLLLDSMLHI